MPTGPLDIAGFVGAQTLYRSECTIVFRAHRSQPERDVVLKLVSPGCPRAERARRRIEHEYAILDSLRGVPGITQVLELVPTPIGPALELVNTHGAVLASRMGKPWALGAFFDTARDLARVVAAMHENGVVHRDINPNNLLVLPKGVELIDFGLSTRLSQATPGRELAGTLGYLAPEQTGQMNRSVDWRADLYGLGCVLFELLTGRPPFALVDPLSLVHATIARQAPSVSSLRPDVPEPLSEMVGVLLRKMAEDRYQSARGLLHDLERCAHAWGTEGSVSPFALREHDYSSRFVLPQRLYGREEQLAGLQRALRQASKGVAVVIGVRGPTGIGKTVLVRELVRHVADQGGLFAEGKFDALRRSQPYACLVDAIRGLVDSLLVARADTLAAWRSRLIEQVGGFAPVLTEAIPELAGVLGEQPAPHDLPAGESKLRFHDALDALLRALTRPGEPLVLFLDDVQWADRATLDLLAEALTLWQQGSLLLVLSWRTEELGPAHPLSVVLNRLPEGVIEYVDVGPLSVEAVAALIGDAFRVDAAPATALAELVVEKTEGNPFFVREFLTRLHERGLLVFSADESRWAWRLDELRPLAVTTNVADMLMERMEELSSRAVEALAVAACLGTRWDPELLIQTASGDRASIAGALLESVERGLLEPRGDAYDDLRAASLSGLEGEVRGQINFRHDRVQEAALGLLHESNRATTHLRVARLLVARGDHESDVFTVVDQFNRGLQALGDADERRTVARLNLVAGQRARASGAFEIAMTYFEAGTSLLPDTAWDTDYKLAFDLHVEAADACVLTPDRQASRPFAQMALQRAANVLDRVRAQEAHIRADLAKNDNEAAVERCLEALSWLDVNLKARPTMVSVAFQLLRTHLRVRRLTRADLDALTTSDDPTLHAAMRLLMHAGTPAYYVSTTLMPVLFMRMVSLSLDRGLTPYSSFGFQAWAFIQAAVLRDLPGAELVGGYSRQLVQRLDTPEMACRVDTLYLGFVLGRRKSWHALVEPYLDAHLAGLEAGDGEYAALSGYNHATYSYLAGQPLDLVFERTQAMMRASLRLGQSRTHLQLSLLLQVLGTYRLQARESEDVDPGIVDAVAFEREVERVGDAAGVAVAHVYRLAVLLRLGTAQQAAEGANRAQALISGIPGSPHIPYFHFHAALAWVAVSRSGSSQAKKARKSLRALQGYSKTSPDNHRHQVLLVEAELASLTGNNELALASYDEALTAARALGVLSDASLAAGLATEHLRRLGHHRAAGPYVSELRRALSAWGATGIEAHLGPDLSEDQGVPLAKTTTTWPTFEGVSLNAASVLRAARAISSELDFRQLVKVLLRTIVEAAGADVAILAMNDDGIYRVTAELADGQILLTSADSATPVQQVMPHAWVAVRYATRSRKTVLLPDASVDERFGRHYDSPVSMLCVPLAKGSELVGVVYLENTLATHAFGAEQLEVVEVLAGQAAISLENVRLYDTLRQTLDNEVQLAESYARFMPPQFLRLLGKRSVLEVSRGDAISGDFSILFADIRGFTPMAEQLGHEATFAFINQYLHYVEPAIHTNRGFVHQLLGDGIVAVFPSADDVLRAGLAMTHALQEFNEARAADGDAPVRVGIGTNTGRLMMGAIGGPNHLDRGVVGDVMNLASRVEGMTKQYGASMLISGATYTALDDPSIYDLRLIDRVIPVGRSEPLEVYEVLDVLPSATRGQRHAQAEAWRGAVSAWFDGDVEGARSGFASVLEQGDDPAASIFLGRLDAGELPTDERGVTRLTKK